MDNVIVQRNAFVFCRYSVAAIIWLALLLHNVWLLVLTFAILALSAILKVQRAPMVWLYTNTLGRVVPSKDVILDVKAMRFAHTLGALLAAISVSLVFHGSPFAWYFVALFAVLKTVSALGFCPASKLYGCIVKDGGCCALVPKR